MTPAERAAVLGVRPSIGRNFKLCAEGTKEGMKSGLCVQFKSSCCIYGITVVFKLLLDLILPSWIYYFPGTSAVSGCVSQVFLLVLIETLKGAGKAGSLRSVLKYLGSCPIMLAGFILQTKIWNVRFEYFPALDFRRVFLVCIYRLK